MYLMNKTAKKFKTIAVDSCDLYYKKLVFTETIKMQETLPAESRGQQYTSLPKPQTLHIRTFVMKWIWQKFKLEAFGIGNWHLILSTLNN